MVCGCRGSVTAAPLRRGSAVIDTSREANYLEVSDNLGVTNNVVESNADVMDAAGHWTIACGFVPVASESA